ncbi:MAG: response regulator [Halothece sp.]
MDAEAQARQDFLEEAVEYCDQLESALLGVADSGVDLQQLDAAARAAHSIKGGAAMMGFNPLSRTAHSLEDYLKILQARSQQLEIDTQLETLLLGGVDCLREIGEQYRQGNQPQQEWLDHQTHQIFEPLQERLGELTEADETALLSNEEQSDVADLLFGSGVEDCLQRLKDQVEMLAPNELAEELKTTSDELADFGRMIECTAFTSFCESVKQHVAEISPEKVTSLARSAIAQWERSQALIQLGRYDHLPTALDTSEVTAEDTDWEEWDIPDFDEFDASELAELQQEAEQYDISETIETQNLEFDSSQQPVESSDSSEAVETENLELDSSQQPVETSESSEDLEFEEIDFDSEEIAELQEEIEQFQFSEQAEATTQAEQTSVEPNLATAEETQETVAENSQATETQAQAATTPSQREETTVRVSVEQLARINTLFSRLILERERLNSRMKELEKFVSLSKSRTQQLEQANAQLRKWYDQLNSESNNVSHQLQTASQNSQNTEGFDTLEMDRYSDLHLLFQEQIETIVQLQEVTNDIEVSSREVSELMGDLNFTTSDLQQGITKVQTRPFSEAVKRFRRVIRDLSLQHDKPVALDIQGENTLIDRAAFEALSAPLNHLIRNAFDHGIEDLQTRTARGKPKQGTITLNAVNRGNKTTISISDDGGGIDQEKIKDRLEKMGTSRKELSEISDQELLDAIFAPGFSTADRVTELSGRGVGMDVVRTNLEKIRGEIDIDTKPGEGTTFNISFPLSLSIARVVIAESSGVVFALPVEVVQAFAPFNEEIEQSREMFWSDGTIPVFTLEQWCRFNRPIKPFEMEGTATLDRPTVIVVNYYGQSQGIKIDRFWQEQEVALRSVDSPLPLPPGVTGSTVLGDGRPIPLVDPTQLLNWLQQPQTEHEETRDVAADISSETILIVDDSIHVRRYLASALEKAGYQVEQAKDGQEAVDKIFNGLPVQAAICDIEMPRLDGYGVLGEIKGHPDFKHLPIAMLTSRGNEKHRQLAMKLGASAYFSKPYNEQELLNTLASMMQSE